MSEQTISNTTAQVSTTGNTTERVSKLKGITNTIIRKQFEDNTDFADGELMIVMMDEGSRYGQMMDDGTTNTSINILVAMQADINFGAALSGADLDLTYTGYRDGALYRHIVPMPENIVKASGYELQQKFELVRGSRRLPVTLAIEDKFTPQEGRINHQPQRAPIVDNPRSYEEAPEDWVTLTVEGKEVYRHTELKAKAFIDKNPDLQFQVFTKYDQSDMLSELRSDRTVDTVNEEQAENKTADLSKDGK